MALSRIKRLIDQNRYDYTGKIRDRIEGGEFTEDDLTIWPPVSSRPRKSTRKSAMN